MYKSEWHKNSRRKINNVKCAAVKEEFIYVFKKDDVEYQVTMAFGLYWIYLKE